MAAAKELVCFVSYKDSGGASHSITICESGTGGVDGTITQFQFSGGLFDGARTRGEMAVAAGTLELSNSSGAYDSFYSTSFDNQFFGASCSDANVSTFIISHNLDEGIGYPTAVETGSVTEQAMTLFLRDFRFRLRKPYLTTKYAGTNSGSPLAGVEGTAADIAGQRKPRVVGTVFNVEPVLVNTARGIFQVDGQQGLATGWTLTLYDMGVATWTAGANYTSQSDMEGNAPSPGQYRVLPSLGCFRLGSEPGGRLTCDVTNPVSIAGTVSPAASTGTELHVVARAVAFESSSLSPATSPVSSTNTANPVVGAYFSDDSTGLAALNQMLSAVSSSADFTGVTNGAPATGMTLLQASVAALSGSTWDISLTESEILGLRVVQVDDDDRGIPVWRVTVRYARNWTVMADNEIAGSASVDRRNYLKQSFIESVASDATVQSTWPNAPEIVVETVIANQADADAEAARLLALYKVRRLALEIDIPFEHWLNPFTQTDSTGLNRMTSSPGKVALVTYPRFNLSLGRAFLILNRVVKCHERKVTLTVWG